MRYFSIEEFTCKCCGEGADKMSSILLENLDKIRELCGHPIYVSCGYRCPSHNAEVGGVSNSQHIYGKAADIFVDGDLPVLERLYQLILDQELFDGVGWYPDSQFIHVDVRNDGESPNYYLW